MQLQRKSRRSRKEKVLAKDIGLLDNKALLLLLKTLLGKKIVACRVPTRKIVACRTPGRKSVTSRGQTCSSCSLSSPPQASQLVHQGKVLALLSLPSGGKNGSSFKNRGCQRILDCWSLYSPFWVFGFQESDFLWGNGEMWHGLVHYKTGCPPPPRSLPARDLFQVARFIDDPSSQLITLAPPLLCWLPSLTQIDLILTYL